MFFAYLQAVNETRERPRSLSAHAVENLVYIRDAMERAGSFTAVPGWGGVVMGLAGMAAAIIAPSRSSAEGWLLTWLAAALVATTVGVLAILVKSRQGEIPLLSRPARQFALSFSPAVLVGALLTAALYRAGMVDLLPGIWLLLYGAAVVAGGTFSVRIIPLMGLLFLFLGTVALFSSPWLSAICLGVGFGGLHVVFGMIIARRYGG